MHYYILQIKLCLFSAVGVLDVLNVILWTSLEPSVGEVAVPLRCPGRRGIYFYTGLCHFASATKEQIRYLWFNWYCLSFQNEQGLTFKLTVKSVNKSCRVFPTCCYVNLCAQLYIVCRTSEGHTAQKVWIPQISKKQRTIVCDIPVAIERKQWRRHDLTRELPLGLTKWAAKTGTLTPAAKKATGCWKKSEAINLAEGSAENSEF